MSHFHHTTLNTSTRGRMAAGAGSGDGAGQGDGSALWSILWLVVLLIIGFWVSGFCAAIYVLLNTFTACCEGITPVCEILMKGVQFTGLCGKYIAKGTPFSEAFK
ncbi:hypothetical protein OTU49_009607 [Cherax quadricarinatus]|uniref:Caveolin n=1 Tax=Cherax quadricarinatus TaxID=27406 RepID=A0AAW0WJG8_CHEQU|nr:uncharacterized protein LOC128691895 [Cherax quadricarinatus]